MTGLLPIMTSRLKLRQFSADDLVAFQSYRSDPILARYQGWEPVDDEQAYKFLALHADQEFGPEGQWLQVAVTLSDTEQLIGDLGVCIADEIRGVVELGFTLSRKYQRQGYASEAVRGMLAGLFGAASTSAVVAMADTRNDAAIKLLYRTGFCLIETSEAVFRGELCREHKFEITRSRWLDQNSQ